MFGGNFLKLVMDVLLFGIVLGQQQQRPIFLQQVGPNIQPPQRPVFVQQLAPTAQPLRPIQPLRLLSTIPSNPSSQNLLLEQQQNEIQPGTSAQNLVRDQERASNALSPHRFTSKPQVHGQQVPILEDIRDGPFHDGSYYFGYVSSDGSVREEAAIPTADGSFIVTGSYRYASPNGEVIDMQYISDANGYRAFPKGSRPFTPPQRILNAPILPNIFVDEIRQEFIRPILNQRPQPFRPVLTNVSSNQVVNRPFNRPDEVVLTQPALGGLNPIVSNGQTAQTASSTLTADLTHSEGSFSTNLNDVTEPVLEKDI